MPRKRECQGSAGAEHAGRVQYMEDPYASQVYGDHRKVWLCEACAQAAADDA